MSRILLLIGILLMFIGLIIAGMEFHSDRYKKGQIDALTGKICYKLEQQQDGTTIWVQIKEQHEPPMQNRTAR
jgi:hypothetical protein